MIELFHRPRFPKCTQDWSTNLIIEKCPKDIPQNAAQHGARQADGGNNERPIGPGEDHWDHQDVRWDRKNRAFEESHEKQDPNGIWLFGLG